MDGGLLPPPGPSSPLPSHTASLMMAPPRPLSAPLTLLLISSSASAPQGQLPGVSTAVAPPGILRGTAQPGSYQKSVTRILFRSLVVPRGIPQTLCILGLCSLKAGDTGEAATVDGRQGLGGSAGSPKGLRRDELQEPRKLRNQEGSGIRPWALHGTCLALDQSLHPPRPWSPSKIWLLGQIVREVS